MKTNDRKQSYAWNMHYGADYFSKQKAKSLRADPTEAEELLWGLLRNKKMGDKFRRQHAIGIYIADFYCHKLKLVIEVDGEQHSEDEQQNWDNGKTNDFKSLGIELIRFSNYDVLNYTGRVLTQIRQKCLELAERNK